MSIHTAMLQNLEPESARYLPGLLRDSPSREYLLRVMSIADKVINKVNQTELLAFLGVKSDQQTDIPLKTKKCVVLGELASLPTYQCDENDVCSNFHYGFSAFDQQKTALVEAIGRKGCAMAQYYLLYNKNETESEKSGKEVEPLKINLDDIDALWLNIVKYVDAQDVKVCPFRVALKK